MYRKLSLPIHLALLASLLFAACIPIDSSGIPEAGPQQAPEAEGQAQDLAEQEAEETQLPIPSPFPTRPLYEPGELVDYVAQTGDTLPNLAVRFNTTVAEILEANSFIPATATTMPPGMPMKIPIYYLPLWGSPYRIIPDSLFVNGPAQVGFDTVEFVNAQPGWLKNFTTFASGRNRKGGEVVDVIALNYSVSPRLLLALLEYQAGALSEPEMPANANDFVLGYRDHEHKSLFSQLGWAANLLNNGYYGYRTSRLTEIEYRDGRIERFDPWLNAATASLHNFFNVLLPPDQYAYAIAPEGFAQTYRDLFGDPWENEQPHIPGSLYQPEFILPFSPGSVWAYTGGPHSVWGVGEPLAAIDFAPPLTASGCQISSEMAMAVADGVVARSEPGVVVLDLDGDGDERTGWAVFYLHIGSNGRVRQGAVLKQGDPVGPPSCEGGRTTGTHVHIARKYNGEWFTAEGLHGILAFNLEGWVAHNGSREYLGTLTRFSQVVTACECSNAASFIKSEREVVDAVSLDQP